MHGVCVLFYEGLTPALAIIIVSCSLEEFGHDLIVILELGNKALPVSCNKRLHGSYISLKRLLIFVSTDKLIL